MILVPATELVSRDSVVVSPDPSKKRGANDVNHESRPGTMRLRYVSDSIPGIIRSGSPGGFVYQHSDGACTIDEQTLERIRKLAIPPAYTSVWICPLPDGHLQAVGRDAKGRKQYRYHPLWRTIRDEEKYDRLVRFGRVLPKLRRRVSLDLSSAGLKRDRVLAAVVRLLEMTLARVGNSEYARANGSFGLTTLRNRHVRISGSRLVLDFRGKHGIRHNIDLCDRRLTNIVRRCRDLPGQDLFRYVGENGATHLVGSQDVNDYLREITNEEITAKDFRTWAATTYAAMALRESEGFESQTQANKNMLEAIDRVAALLRNTRAICRKCYIHPAIFDGYLDGSLLGHLKRYRPRPSTDSDSALGADEKSVLAFLTRRVTSS
jgi:DNA topoisomerase I